MSWRFAAILTGSLSLAGCRSSGTESDGAEPATPPPAARAPAPSNAVVTAPAEAPALAQTIDGGRRVFIMDQSVSMVGFSTSGALRQVEDAIGHTFKAILGDGAGPWQFYGVAEQVKPTRPPLAEAARLVGKATNLEAAVGLLAEPDVALGVLVTDGLPSGDDPGKRPCYDLELPNVEPFAKTFSQTIAAGSALWMVLARLPFKGSAYLNCNTVASHQLASLRKAFGGNGPKCYGGTRYGCRCGGECKVKYSGGKPVLIFVVSEKQWVEKTRAAVAGLVNDLLRLDGIESAVAMELYPGTPDSWALVGRISSHRLDLLSLQDVRTTAMAEEPIGSGHWIGRDLCVGGEDNVVAFEVCAKRVPDPTVVLDSLDISPPQLRFEVAGVHTEPNRGLTIRTLGVGREFLVWDGGMLYSKEPGLIKTSEFASCASLFEKVKHHREWGRPVPNAGQAEWCRQVVLSCGCLEQEGKIGPDQVARVAMDLVYTVTPTAEQVPEELTAYSVNREPYLHPDKIYGLESLVKAILRMVVEGPGRPVERRFGRVELSLRRSQ